MNTEDALHSISPSPLSAGRQLSFPNFGKWGIEKENECLGGLKVLATAICLRRLPLFFVSKRTL